MATGRKTVVVGQVIDPVQWGNPLWDQSIQTFASAAARTAQFPAPLQGAVTWLEDSKRLEVFNGTAWVISLPPASIAVSDPGQTVPGGWATFLQMNLATGIYDFQASGTAEWSTAGAPRYLIRLVVAATSVELDHTEVYTTALGGSIPFFLQANYIGVGGVVALQAYQTGATSGTTQLKNLKMKARRTDSVTVQTQPA